MLLQDVAKAARKQLKIPATEKLFIMDDNFGAHTAPAAREAHAEFNLERLFYPPRSPDFNPPEELFSDADSKKLKMDYEQGPAPSPAAAAVRFKQICEQACRNGSQLRAARSLPRRIEECRANEGAATSY